MQRAKDYKPNTLKANYLWASRKIDGVRGQFEDSELYTREYIEISGLEHIKKECKEIISKYGFSFIAGEFSIINESFDTIQGAVLSKNHIKKQDIIFNVFAIGGDFEKTGEMVSKIRKAFANCQYLKPVDYEKIQERDINDKMQQYIDEGFEGIVLRLPENPLEDNSLYRKKPFKELDFIIIDYYESKSKGLLGGVVVKAIIDGKEIISKDSDK